VPEHAVDILAPRKRLLDEEVLNAAVLSAAQEHDLGALDGAAGAADLLIVGDDRSGRLVVDDEAEVGLVVAHPQGTRGDDRLQVVGEQAILDGDPPLGLDLAGVRLGGDPVRGEPGGDLLGVALGQRVDDPRARQVGQVGGEPGEPVGLAGQLDDLEAQARAAERPAVDHERRARVPGAQLVLDVGDDAVVGGRRRAQRPDAGGQSLEHLGDAPVVGAKVVPPVADAVRLVDHEQPHPLGEHGQHPRAELRVVQPLGADEQEVHGIRLQQPGNLRPCVAIRRVDRVRPDPEPLRRRDLVAHERQQRRDDERRPRPALAQEGGRDEVQRRLAPARPLHAQHPRPLLDEIGDRLELVLAEGGAGAGERLEERGGAGGEVGPDRHAYGL
jgi:hypothetical protein